MYLHIKENKNISTQVTFCYSSMERGMFVCEVGNVPAELSRVRFILYKVAEVFCYCHRFSSFLLYYLNTLQYLTFFLRRATPQMSILCISQFHVISLTHGAICYRRYIVLVFRH